MPTALFMGRFQPPHVGHILTIRALASQFDRLIVGVTEAQPSVMPVHNVIDLLQILLPDTNIELVHITGSVEGGTAKIDVEFDVCCSGNMAVLDIMKANGYQTQYTERSQDHIYSGTHERESYVAKAIASRASQPLTLTEFTLVATESLRPIEKINPRHYAAIEKDILDSQVMNKPLIVDKLTLAVLDGSHRYAFMLKHGFQDCPAILCDYDDESIFVGTHLQHRFEYDADKWISKKHVRATAVSGTLYEPRTTRHFFPFRKTDTPTPLNSLTNLGVLRSIDHLMFNTTAVDEIGKNDIYIEELEQELKALSQYQAEQTDVREWLRAQNELIRSSSDT